MGTIRDFLVDVRTRVEAVVDGAADPVFARVWIAPFIDLERMLLDPRWPAAIVVDNGGNYDEFNGKIMTRSFTVAVVDGHPRDHMGEESVLQVLDRGQELMEALEYDTTIEIFNAGDDDLGTIGTDGGLLILVKPYRFTAVYERP